jgi:hypothetical protein
MQELIIFFGMLIFSLILENTVISKKKVGAFSMVTKRLAYIGVFVHEVAHKSMCVLLRVDSKDFSVRWRTRLGERSPHGSVTLRETPNFIQAVLICFAPLYVSTWLFFLCLQLAFSPYNFHPLINISSGVLCLSLALGAAPSPADFSKISQAIHESPSYSLYQMFLVVVSTLLLWFLLITTQIVFILDIFYYLSISGIYGVLKGSIYGINYLMNKIHASNYERPTKFHLKGFMRRRYRPKKPFREW